MIKQFTTAALLACISVTAIAADSAGPYMGADFGRTKADRDPLQLGSMKDDNSVGIFGGYRFNENLALEASYRNLGDYTFLFFSFTNYGQSVTTAVDVRTKQSAASVLLSAPLGSSFSVFTRLGYNRLSAKAHGQSVSDSGALLGLGLDYALTANVAARLEYQRPASDLQNLSLGVSYKF
jgi:opacity protein-like surface antigen